MMASLIGCYLMMSSVHGQTPSGAGPEAEMDPVETRIHAILTELLRGEAAGDAPTFALLFHRRVADELGVEHRYTTTLARRLATELHEKGYYQTAVQLSELEIKGLEISEGEEHPATLTALNNLAVKIQEHGDLQGAREIQEKVVSVRNRVLGPGNMGTLIAKSNLALTLAKLGDYHGARELQQEVLDSFESLLGSEHAHALTAKNNLASTLFNLGDLNTAQQLQQETLQVQNRALGPEHLDSLNTLAELAQTLRAQGNLVGAERHERKVLEVLQRVLGSEHPKTLNAKSNLAVTLQALGNLSEAQELLQETLAAGRRVLGPEHPQTLTVQNNLAAAIGAFGDLSGALQLQQEVLEARLRILGPEHPETLTAKANLAQTRHDLGEFEGARKELEDVLEARRRVLGPEHPKTLDTENNLAGAYFALGDLVGAHRRHQNVLDQRNRLLGPRHQSTLTSKSNLALVLHAQGLFEVARRHQEEVSAGLLEVLGPEHPDTLTAMNNLANTAFSMGDLVRAKKMEDEVLQARHRLLGPSHPQTLTSRSNLAATLYAMGDFQAARQHQVAAIDGLTATFGVAHPLTLKAKGNLSSTLVAGGDLAAGRLLQDEAIDGLSAILGPAHPDTLTARAHLAETFRSLGDFPRARQQQEEILRLTERHLGPGHPETLTSINNLAEILRSQGDLEEARKLLERVGTVLNRTLGEEHPTTLSAQSNLAATLRDSGHLNQAKQIEERIFGIRARILGPSHPDTRRSSHNLAGILQDLGEVDAAIRVLEPALEYSRNPADEHVATTELEVQSLWLLGELYRQAGRLQEAGQVIQSALDAVEAQAATVDFEEEAQSRYHTKKQIAFYEALALAFRQDQPEAAFNILERYRTFSQVAEQIRNGSLSRVGDSELKLEIRSIGVRYDQITERLSYLDPRADPDTFKKLVRLQTSLRREREVKLGQLARERRNDPAFPRALTAEQVQRRLEPETALLAFSFGGFTHHGFVLTRDDVMAFKIEAEPSDLRLQVQKIYAHLQTNRGDGGNLVSKTAWLARKLMGPAMDLLEQKKRWLILPDGLLHYLPFAALAFEKRDGEKAWLLQKHAVHIVQSTTVYDELIKKRPSSPRRIRQGVPRWLALGDPVYGLIPEGLSTPSAGRIGFAGEMAPLPNTKRELAAIEALFAERSQPTEAHLGLDATEDCLHRDLRGIDYIHIASHGISLPNEPQQGLHPSDSFLALTLLPDNERKKQGLKQNGLLQAWEIANHLKLDAELVVLSACETAIGENRGGEGLMSLARAFLQAGARSVLASLWQVDDLSTSELMIRFYRHLLDGESKVDALRLAQMELASGPIMVEIDGQSVEKDFTAPYYWAGFQLIGDWK